MDWGDDRAQALQVGAVLLLGILVIALSIYQVTVVPQENREVEFDSYLDASTDMSDLRNDVLASAQRGVRSGTTVRTGTTYPARALFVNPPPASGRLDALAPRNVTIDGAVAVSGEPNAVGDVWNGSARNYSTREIRFRPDYSRFEGSPVVVVGGSVYRATDNGPIPLASQSLVDGNRLTLVTVGGDVSTGGLASTVTTEPVSRTERTVAVRGAGGDDFTVTYRFASPAAAAAWNDSRVAAGYREQPRVNGTVHPAGEPYVNLTFVGSATYELRVARVTVQEATDATAVEEPDPAYVLPVAGNESSVANGSSVTLTAEVRDRYNNPVTGTDVTFESADGTFAATGSGTRTVTTTDDGRVSVRFAPNATGTANATASFERPTSFNETRFEVDVEPVDGRDGGNVGGVINPNSPNAVVLEDATIVDSGAGEVEVDFSTLGNEDREFLEFRVNFYYERPTNPGGNPSGGTSYDDPQTVTVTGEGGAPSETVSIGGPYAAPSSSYVIDGTGPDTTITFDFDASVEEADFFTFSVILDDEDSATYFVVPRE
jgi:hypothetical protein